MGKDKVNGDKRINGGGWKRRNRVPNSLRHELQRGKRFYWVLRAASLTPSSSARLILELCSGSSDRRLRSFKQGASKVRGPDKADQKFNTSH